MTSIHRSSVSAHFMGVVSMLMLTMVFAAPMAHAAKWYVNAASTAAAPDGKGWDTAFSAIQPAVDVSSSGDELWVAAGTYTGTGDQAVNLKAGISLYGGFAGSETERGQRDWKAHLTIIDGQKARRCVTAVSSTVVDGFTIRNGRTAFCAGMYDGMATNCTFNENAATDSGGGMYRGTARNCTFNENTAINCGGGKYEGVAVNCVFVKNSADSGGGMFYSSAMNCTCAGNIARSDGGGMYGGTAVNCILWENSPQDELSSKVTFSCVSEETYGMANIVGNPGFVNPWTGDFRLRADSPCLNAGTTLRAPATDLLGRARPQGAGIDIGAYEYYSGDDAQAVGTPILRVNAASTATNPDGLTWETAFATLQAAVDHPSYDREVWVAAGIYTGTENEVVRLLPGTALFGGFAGDETERGQRDWKAHLTIIDGQKARRCVTAVDSSAVDGFTVQNGSATYGGGMYYGMATNCTFNENAADSDGGGMYHGTARNCTFNENTAINCGGGKYEGVAVNCMFVKDSADIGGGMYYGLAMNCTYAQNMARFSGGGICESKAVNCIFWGNTSLEANSSTVSYSCLSTENAGTGNINGDPGFVNPWNGDFRLRVDSPCLNAGTTEGAPTTDLLGRKRPQGTGIDMGAYEYCAGDDAQAVLPPAVLRVNAASAAVSPDGLTWETAFSTLQAAADRAGYGTELWVAQGTYTALHVDQVVWLKPGTSMYGGFTGAEAAREARAAPAGSTVIDGQGRFRCVTAAAAVLVDGFTLQHGFAVIGGGMSGGTAVNCVFAENRVNGYDFDAGSQGGGMFCGTAVNCTFNGNTADGQGGGMFYGTASNCMFSGNRVTGPDSMGGGIYSGTATNCTFDRNAAANGGGMCAGAAQNCLFKENTAGYYGGGMSYGTAINCTFTGNSVTSGNGGGLYSGAAINCILWHNHPNEVYNLIGEHPEDFVHYSCLSVAMDGTGNIVGDPLFVDEATGDFRLQSGSPCINTGTGDGAPSADILGVPRPQGLGFDMGAYETVVPVTMPDLSGLVRATAKELTVAAQLYVGKETEEYNPAIPGDHIIRHTPVAGAQVPQWSLVDLVISKGPQPGLVPNVVGQMQDAATGTIMGAGLAVGTLTQQYSLIVPTGTVMAQNPTPGAEVLPGTAVDLVLSKGGIAVPDAVGQTQSAAAVAIVNVNLMVGAVTQQYSAAVPVGTVISQTPAAGTPALPGTAVALVISRGVQPSVMPDVVGQPQAQAEAAIISAGLVPGTVTQTHSSTIAVGSVIVQSPATGTELPPGTAVSIVVSLGPVPVAEGEGEPVELEVAREKLGVALAAADTDNDGRLSFAEAAVAVPGLTQAVFDALDADADGQLTSDELGMDNGSGCAGCEGGKSVFSPGRHTSDLFLTALGLLGLAVMVTVRRP